MTKKTAEIDMKKSIQNRSARRLKLLIVVLPAGSYWNVVSRAMLTPRLTACCGRLPEAISGRFC